MIDTSVNFWVARPTFKEAGPTKELHKKDRTKNKDKSSQLMWAIALLYDRSSEFYNLDEETKTHLVFNDFYGDADYPAKNKEQIKLLKDFYTECSTTVAERELINIENKLKERGKFLDATPYDMGVPGERGGWVGNTVDTLDKMMANTPKLFELYTKAKEAVMEEQAKSTVGNRTESLTDTGEI